MSTAYKTRQEENSSIETRLSENSKHDHVSETLTNESTKKNDTIKKKTEKIRKEENLKTESVSNDLVAIGKSICGRWIKFKQTLGEGSYKTVYKGYDSEKGNNIAWCEFKRQHVDTKEKQVNMIKEIEIMVKMNHPNIVSCYDIFDEYIDSRSSPINIKSIVLIQELLNEGTLKSVIKKNFINGIQILDFSLILYWLHQIIDALAYMHEKLKPPIIHRDIKADNCFLESKSSEKCLNVKVGDFGLAKQVNSKEKNTMLGTVGFMAPEVYDEKYDFKVDIYAFGMLMLEVITNRTPYDECETVMQVAKLTMSGQMPEIFSLVSDQWTREVISCCIHPLPKYRPTAMELFYHPIFLKNILPIEITPNSNTCTDRETIINTFISNMVTENEGYNVKFNLRMDFRNKRIQKSFDLDEGESLEFDLDVFKEDDVLELITNLKSEYENNVKDVLSLNKNLDAKAVKAQLEKFFKSMELQMNFVLKMLLGKRWRYVLEMLLVKQSDMAVKDDITGFSLLANYKKKWLKATKQLETEILNYSKVNVNNEKKKSRIIKATDNMKFESISNTPESNLEDLKNIRYFDNKHEKFSTQKMIKETSELCSQMPLYQNTASSQTNAFPFGYIPVMNPALNPIYNPLMNPNLYPNMYFVPPTQLGCDMLNSIQQPFLIGQSNKDEYDNLDRLSSKTNNTEQVPILEASSKSPSEIQKLIETSKNLKECYMERIYTIEEITKYMHSQNSKNPFIVIPIDQTNTFYLFELNHQNSLENPYLEEIKMNLVSEPGKNVNKHKSKSSLKVDQNSYLNMNPYSSYLHPYNASTKEMKQAEYSQNFMQNYFQQQYFFQNQLFQQQRLFWQQQQQLQNEHFRMFKNHNLEKKSNSQQKKGLYSGIFETQSIFPNEQQQKSRGPEVSKAIKSNDSAAQKFTVKNIEQWSENVFQFNNKESTFEEDKITLEDEVQSTKKKENNCNLDEPNIVGDKLSVMQKKNEDEINLKTVMLKRHVKCDMSENKDNKSSDSHLFNPYSHCQLVNDSIPVIDFMESQSLGLTLNISQIENDNLIISHTDKHINIEEEENDLDNLPRNSIELNSLSNCDFTI